MQGAPGSSTLESVAPGSLVLVRDEEWLVTHVGPTRDGTLITCQGLSELVAGSTVQFFEGLDTITPFDPRQTRVVADSSRNHQKARLWLEATLRKTALPIDDDTLAVTGSMLADALDYQRAAIKQALDPDTLRPRILLADAVRLGKAPDIGMILAELVRRGRGERVLVVTPPHVLKQIQHELWCRFALPFVRLDSVGISASAAACPRRATRSASTSAPASRSTPSRTTVTSPASTNIGGTRSSSTSRTTSPIRAPRTVASQACSPHRPAAEGSESAGETGLYASRVNYLREAADIPMLPRYDERPIGPEWTPGTPLRRAVDRPTSR
ncbi:hypothetical protein [Mobilicoccus caccae]|uniref:Helicase ATP-binding domain-containing protein n=1 Tax=Mobilicoccus caccae TaxID=1859295 RepID=A0ABQ6IS31_9MICO|nr:hypothetical protein [Mobilicoccus caccae]GMA40279.1 hypothetical protein GCM10025883_23240 [Mobilicoccus caccae]